MRARANLLHQSVGRLLFNEPALVDRLVKTGFVFVADFYAAGAREKLTAKRTGISPSMFELLKSELRAANLPDDFDPGFDTVALIYRMAHQMVYLEGVKTGEKTGRTRVFNFTFASMEMLHEGQTVFSYCEGAFFGAVAQKKERVGFLLDLNDAAVHGLNAPDESVEFEVAAFANALARARAIRDSHRRQQLAGAEVIVEFDSPVWFAGGECPARVAINFTKGCGSIMFDPEERLLANT
jgi:hypothetical protein